jgi:hypothetical protein
MFMWSVNGGLRGKFLTACRHGTFQHAIVIRVFLRHYSTGTYLHKKSHMGLDQEFRSIVLDARSPIETFGDRLRRNDGFTIGNYTRISPAAIMVILYRIPAFRHTWCVRNM